jgi:hypothetical protein
MNDPQPEGHRAAKDGTLLSAADRVVNIDSVDAVTIPRVSPAVVIAHSTIQHTSAVLPMPWPEATAIWMALPGVSSPSRICSNTHRALNECERVAG